MKILVIHCLPNQSSFTRKIKNAFLAGVISSKRHQIEEIDLIQHHFDPLLYLPEKDQSGDVFQFQQKILTADILVFAYPTWWFSMPALMKGFFDRVFKADFAFKYLEGHPHGLLTNIKATYIISSMGVSFWSEFFNINGARSFYSNIKGILKFCGIKKIHRLQAYNLTKHTTNNLALKYISKARKAGEKL